MPFLAKLRALLRKLTSETRKKAERHAHVHLEEEGTLSHLEGICLCEAEAERRKRDFYAC